jgi:hypothetical protein
MKVISQARFISAVGYDPENDDLDRSNCRHAGALGHLCCGWNDEQDKPQFLIGPLPWNGKPFPRDPH